MFFSLIPACRDRSFTVDTALDLNGQQCVDPTVQRTELEETTQLDS